MKIIVVGGVAGGATAVARLRRLDESAEILMLERGDYVSFANCGLPYYLGGVIRSRDALFVSDQKSIEAKYGVEIRTLSEVTEIDREGKRVKIRDLRDGKEYEEAYDKLLLSTGSHPFVPPMEGVDADNVFTLWNIRDTDRIYDYMREKKPGRALVVGGGFIGIEMAENLAEKGLKVTLAEFSGQVMPPLDPDMARLVENHMRVKGIDLLLNTGLEALSADGRRARLSGGREIETDITLLSIGVRPNSELAVRAGLSCNARGGVIVDDYMQTSDPDIYAIGDMIEITNPISGLKGMVPLAGPANKQGRAVAANILGRKAEAYEGTIGTSVAKVFDLTVASTGENEKALQARGLVRWKDYGLSLVHPVSHAGYYPGAVPLTIKLLFSMKDGAVLGAQIVGYDGVDKRIDTVAATLHFHGSVYDLTRLELAYAPPYSSAKDPVNMAGYAACNILEGLTRAMTQEEFQEEADRVTLIDVREEPEFAMGAIPGARLMPLSTLRSSVAELDPNGHYVVSCAVGLRGYLASRILMQAGLDVRNLLGGYRSYCDLYKTPDQTSGPASVEQEKLVSDREEESGSGDEESVQLDACGLSCPGPIVSVSKKMAGLKAGDILRVKATDPGFARDIGSWCSNTGNILVESGESRGICFAKIRKGEKTGAEQDSASCCSPRPVKEKTMIVFDGDLDKAIAAFIIATGSAAMGNKVNMFFTFWGLNILRRNERQAVRKDLIGRMFGAMMPRGSRRLSLSKMNFLGMGSRLMRSVMKKKGIASLEDLIREAREAGVKMTACQMSMDVMGITKEELIEGVEIGGVATMLDDNDHSNMNLFI